MNGPRSTQGATLIVTVLIVMLMMAAILAVTAQFSLASRRTSADQDTMLRAQYAAEAGVARAQAQLEQMQQSMTTGKLNQTTNVNPTLRGYFAQFCGVQASALTAFATTTPATPLKICDGTVSNAAGTIFANLVPTTPQSRYPAGWTADTWNQIFDADGLALTATQVGGATVNTSVRLIPVKVEQVALDNFRLQIRVESVKSTGALPGGKRVISLKSDRIFNVIISRPSFSLFAQFRNHTDATGAGENDKLSFAAGESFNGPVHTNESLNLSGNGSVGPIFYDEISTAVAENAVVYSNLPCSKSTIAAGACTQMFPNGGGPLYGVPSIPLPTNDNDQLRAALGIEETRDANDQLLPALTDLQLRQSLGLVSTTPNGVYFSKAASPTTLMGGLYIKGNAGVRLSTQGTPTKQIIQITQGSNTTRLTEQPNGGWRVSVNGGAETQMSGSFNGMIYGDGNVDLSGDGTTAADVAAGSAMTLAVRNGDVKLKNSITYAENPLTNPEALNVLGLFNSTGSILLDGPTNEDMNVQATVLASKSGEGFGTVNAGSSRGTVGGLQPRVNLMGGVIEDQSQTVSSNGGGYRRNYTYDPRFRRGYSPPYFPTQQRWVINSDPTFDIGVWNQDK